MRCGSLSASPSNLSPLFVDGDNEIRTANVISDFFARLVHLLKGTTVTRMDRMESSYGTTKHRTGV